MRTTTAIVTCLFVVACGGSERSAGSPCGARGEIRRAAETTGEAVGTGVETAVEGAKTVGKSGAGLVTGGTDKAKAEWQEGAADTEAAAKGGAADTEAAADDDPCP